jgi:hypothetical protein
MVTIPTPAKIPGRAHRAQWVAGAAKFVNRLNCKTMETKKMSLANIKGKLSREEMKHIIAGNEDAKCVKDGESCPWFKKCCNECLATFKCGSGSVTE